MDRYSKRRILRSVKCLLLTASLTVTFIASSCVAYADTDTVASGATVSGEAASGATVSGEEASGTTVSGETASGETNSDEAATTDAMTPVSDQYADYLDIEGFSCENGKLYYYGLELDEDAMYEETDAEGNVWYYDPLDPEFLEYFGDKINVEPIAEEQEVIVSVPKGSSNSSLKSSINGQWYEYPSYAKGKDYMNGVDVSYYQKSINWSALASRGVEFAFIRAGYRGYGDSGNMREDNMCAANIQGAYNAGIKVGIYFLSQATNTSEAAAEASKCADIISPYKSMITLPVIMDYEYAGSSTNPGRLKKQHVADMNSGRDYKAIHNSVLNSFFARMNSYGYTSGVYANRSMLESQLYPGDIASDNVIWLANYTNATPYSGRLEGWQYTSSYTGFSPYMGCDNIDLDFWFGGEKEEEYHPDENQVRAFVTRLYRTCLEREPEVNGREWWVAQLMNGNKTGADAVCGFYLGDELTGRGYSNDKLVELAYKGIMGRNSDAAGKAYWVNRMNNGYSYQAVVAGFIDSTEFESLCKQYGIKKGSSDAAKAANREYGIKQYVTRMYTKALGRNPEKNGMDYWCARIDADSSRDNLLNVALDGFLHSTEFINFNLSDEEYVKVLYRTFMGREGEASGIRFWTDALAEDPDRDFLAQQFAYSKEFDGIMSSYGL